VVYIITIIILAPKHIISDESTVGAVVIGRSIYFSNRIYYYVVKTQDEVSYRGLCEPINYYCIPWSIPINISSQIAYPIHYNVLT